MNLRKLNAVIVFVTLMAVAVYAFADGDPVNPSARLGGRNSEVCVTNGAGGTYVPGGASAAPLADRKYVAIQNLGPNNIFCTVGGATPLNTGALGYRIATGVTWEPPAGANVTVRCIAVTAAQVTPACTQLVELR